MGRPKKASDDKRDQVVNFRLTVAEHEDLRSQAFDAGLPLAELVRRRSLGQTVGTSRRQSDPALITEINRVGVNVNQLARAVHRDADFVRHWRAIADQVSGLLEKLTGHDGS